MAVLNNFWCMTNMEELAKQLMSILSSWIKEVIKKKQHVCKLHVVPFKYT